MVKSVYFLLFFFSANLSVAQPDVVDVAEEGQNLRIESPTIPKPTEPEGQKIEKIQVTGSHIRRMDVEGPSPVLTIDEEALFRSGYNSVSDVLRDIGANSFGSFREHGGFVGSGTATVNLRGVGEQRTLVLLNGKRLPTDALNGAVDLNLLPMAAVERIDVLKDGASAVYGSDALGGVVNIITKKDFAGIDVRGNNSFAELGGGDRRDLSLTYGYLSSKVRSTNVVFMRQNTRIYARDREWSKVGFSQSGSPGTAILEDGTNVADPDCEAQGGVIVPVARGTRCGYNFAERQTEMPDVFQTSFFSDNEFTLSGTSAAYTRLGYTFSKNVWQIAPAFAIGTNSSPLPSKTTPHWGDLQGKVVNTIYRLAEAGDRVQDTDTNNGSLMVGYKKELGDSWQIDSSVSYNRIWRVARRTSGYILRDGYLEKMQNGDPTSGGFNPMAKTGARGSLADIKYVPRKETLSDLGLVTVNADGEIGEVPAGAIGMAVGVQATNESFQDIQDDQTISGNVVGIAASEGQGARHSTSAYSEVSLPLSTSIESQVALRYDNYSDFGSTFNPKLGVRWQATNKLAFRSSVGTGFRAPALQDFYQAQSTAYPAFVDHVACRRAGNDPNAQACKPQSYRVDRSGNPNLGEERSLSANFGTIWQFLADQSVSADLWLYDLTDLVGMQEEDLTRAEANGADVRSRGVFVDRNPVTGEINSITAPLQNLSSTEVFGMDFNYLARYKTRIGDFGLNLNHSQLFWFKEEGFPGAGKRNKLGESGKPAWRNNTTLFYFPNDRNEVSVLARTIGEHDKVVRARGEQTTYTEYDLRYGLKVFGAAGKLTFQVRNVLNTIPPVDDSNPLDLELLFGLYDERGRQFVVGYQHIF